MRESELNALKRACAYSMQPNVLGYCGPPDSWRYFQAFLSNPMIEQNATAAKLRLQQFYALNQYLELIAAANDLQPFDEAIIEAYWLGN